MKNPPPSRHAVTAGFSPARRRLLITGLVQGVGFRPYVYRLAEEHHLAGWVKNTSQGVVVEVEGLAAAVEEFLRRLPREAPALARVEGITVQDSSPLGERSFVILESEHLPGTEAVIPPDVGLCEACAREIRDPGDRRCGYPFTNCTDCGPRFTLIRQVPYDRRQTTMAVFAMCPACREEYENPRDRRFHAEPVACPECGPVAWLEDLVVTQAHRGRGLGGRLLAGAEAWAVRHGLRRLQLVAEIANRQALDFYRQHAWQETHLVVRRKRL